MVKGISRQVILVHAPEQELFEQAIFILKDEAVGQGITEEELLKQARAVVRTASEPARWRAGLTGPFWACGGALVTAAIWGLTVLL